MVVYFSQPVTLAQCTPHASERGRLQNTGQFEHTHATFTVYLTVFIRLLAREPTGCLSKCLNGLCSSPFHTHTRTHTRLPHALLVQQEHDEDTRRTIERNNEVLRRASAPARTATSTMSAINAMSATAPAMSATALAAVQHFAATDGDANDLTGAP